MEVYGAVLHEGKKEEEIVRNIYKRQVRREGDEKQLKQVCSRCFSSHYSRLTACHYHFSSFPPRF